jgi:hypothetical protein
MGMGTRQGARLCSATGTEKLAPAFSRHKQSTEDKMIKDKMIEYVIPIAILFGTTAPAFAADYYIVRGSDKRCKIVEMRPTDKTMVVVGDKAYVSREEAMRQMAVVCKEEVR